jgi:stalled ribosome rescue protein Dom34
MKNIGLWIDHRKSVIVSLTDGVEETQQIDSDVEKHIRFAGGAQAVTAEDMRDRRFANHLNKYYDSVIERIHGADAILILGPGEAKAELEKRLESTDHPGQTVVLETVDKLTDRQIAAKVRQHFH